MPTTTQDSPLTGLSDNMANAAVWLARIDAHVGNCLEGGYVNIDSIDVPTRLQIEIEVISTDQVVLCADRLMDAGFDVKHITNRAWRWKSALEVEVEGLRLVVGAQS